MEVAKVNTSLPLRAADDPLEILKPTGWQFSEQLAPQTAVVPCVMDFLVVKKQAAEIILEKFPISKRSLWSLSMKKESLLQ